MTRAYLFGKDKDGKRVPMEVEYLNKEELKATMHSRDSEELTEWIWMMGQKLVELEKFLESEGYIKKERENENE